jgi:hypothetical protein
MAADRGGRRLSSSLPASLVVAALLFASVAGMHPLLSEGKSGPILLISIAIGAAALAAAMLHRAMQRYAKSDQSLAPRSPNCAKACSPPRR